MTDKQGASRATFETEIGTIGVAAIDLLEGQQWSDMAEVTFRRDEATMLAVVIARYVDDSREVIAKAKHASAESNPDLLERIAATVTGIKLMESLRTILRASGAIGSTFAPEAEREEIREALAQARADVASKETPVDWDAEKADEQPAKEGLN